MDPAGGLLREWRKGCRNARLPQPLRFCSLAERAVQGRSCASHTCPRFIIRPTPAFEREHTQVNPSSIPVWISWMRYPAPLPYAFEALLTNEVSGLSFDIVVSPFLPGLVLAAPIGCAHALSRVGSGCGFWAKEKHKAAQHLQEARTEAHQRRASRIGVTTVTASTLRVGGGHTMREVGCAAP